MKTKTLESVPSVNRSAAVITSVNEKAVQDVGGTSIFFSPHTKDVNGIINCLEKASVLGLKGVEIDYEFAHPIKAWGPAGICKRSDEELAKIRETVDKLGLELSVHSPCVAIPSKEGATFDAADLTVRPDAYREVYEAAKKVGADYVVVHLTYTDGSLNKHLKELLGSTEGNVAIAIENSYVPGHSPDKKFQHPGAPFGESKKYHTTDYLDMVRSWFQDPELRDCITKGRLALNPDIAHYVLGFTMPLLAGMGGTDAVKSDSVKKEMFELQARKIGAEKPLEMLNEIEKIAKENGVPLGLLVRGVHMAQTNGYYDGHIAFDKDEGVVKFAPPGQPPEPTARAIISIPEVTKWLEARNLRGIVEQNRGGDLKEGSFF